MKILAFLIPNYAWNTKKFPDFPRGKSQEFLGSLRFFWYELLVYLYSSEISCKKSIQISLSTDGLGIHCTIPLCKRCATVSLVFVNTFQAILGKILTSQKLAKEETCVHGVNPPTYLKSLATKSHATSRN